MSRLATLLIALAGIVPPMLRAQTASMHEQITQTSARIEQLNILHAGPLERARAWRQLAQLQQDAALYTESAASYAKAIQLFQRAPNPNSELAEAIDGRGTLELETDQLAAAQASLTQARTIRFAMNDTLGVARSDVHLANVYLGEHNNKQAYGVAKKALADFNQDSHAVTLDKSSAMIAISLALCKQNRSGKALPILTDLVALNRQSYPEDSIPVGFSLYLLGYAEQKKHDLPLALVDMQRGIDDLQKPIGWGHPIFLEALTQYASLLRETGRAVDAQQVEARVAQLKSGAHPGTANIDLAAGP